MGLLLGLAFLVKGPVGVVLPLLMILAGRTATGRDVMPSRQDRRHDGSGDGGRRACPGAWCSSSGSGRRACFQLLHTETVDRAVTRNRPHRAVVVLHRGVSGRLSSVGGPLVPGDDTRTRALARPRAADGPVCGRRVRRRTRLLLAQQGKAAELHPAAGAARGAGRHVRARPGARESRRNGAPARFSSPRRWWPCPSASASWPLYRPTSRCKARRRSVRSHSDSRRWWRSSGSWRALRGSSTAPPRRDRSAFSSPW